MDPDTFLGGAMRLDIEAARATFAERIARPLDMDVDAAALGIYRVAVARIADLIRNVTVERGLDPREFTLQSFGGSGGLFAGAYADDLSIGRVVIPHAAAVLCAFGMVTADVVHDYAEVRPMSMPIEPKDVDAVLVPMAERAMSQLAEEGFAKDRCALEWFVEMRYRPPGAPGRDPAAGRTPGHAGCARATSVGFRETLRTALRPRLELSRRRYRARHVPAQSARAVAAPTHCAGTAGLDRSLRRRAWTRPILFVDAGDWKPTTVYDFARLTPGNVVRGPTVVHSPVTTMVVQSGQIARLDGFRNLILESA